MKKPLIALLALTAACSDDQPATQTTVDISPVGWIRGSVEQLQVTHAKPGNTLVLLDANGLEIETGVADEQGSLMFRKVPPGSGYVVRDGDDYSGELTVMTVESSRPPQSFYSNQKLTPSTPSTPGAGYQYITTRDGTTLSAYVTVPGPLEDGPYPTVVNYSGYDPSKPGSPLADGEFFGFCGALPTLCDAPTDPSAMIASMHGYATVSVNMRGTGCSGGAFDYFETMQLLDGYDVIEVVAAQDWVLHNKVGMVGLSYPGISQLFVAAQKPPGLAAITPLSVIGNSATTLKPGGIFNNGFALKWVEAVIEEAAPYGQGWEQPRVDAGDTICEENQLLHSQLVDNVTQARELQFYDPAEHERFNPTSFADQIEVPVFLAGAYQDEQTGPYFSTLIDRFTSSPAVRVNIYNGVHPDGLAPQILDEWFAFLELFVAQRVPHVNETLLEFSPFLFNEFFHAEISLNPSQWSDFTDYEEAKAAWLAAPPVRVLFESGAGLRGQPGAPVDTFEQSYTQWPPPEAEATRYYFQPDGSLATTAPTAPVSASSFHHDPEAGQRGILAPGGRIWDTLPAYDWRAEVTDTAVVFTSAPLADDIVMVGPASVDLWLKSTGTDADLEANLIEVRPGGAKEMYVQSGWLRASFRALHPESTELFASYTFTEDDWAPLAPGEWVEARIGIPGFAHVFRAGSRIKITVDTPGDSRAEWRFDLLHDQDASVRHTIGHDATHASSVVLPIISGADVPGNLPTLPACPSLRGQQCRDAAPFANNTSPI